MSWQFLTAVSVITLAVSVLLQRVLLHKDKSDPIAYVIVFNSLVAAIIFLYSYIHGFHLPDFSKLWLPILITIALYGAGHVAYAKTLQRVEASVFSILFSTNAIWTMVMGLVVFHEQLTNWQLIGAVLIFASVAMLIERKREVKLDSGIWLGLLTGVLFGFATVGWVYVSRFSDAATWTALSFAGGALVVLITNPKSVTRMRPFLSGGRPARLLILGILFSISAVALITAFQYGNVSLIAPLQQTSLILTIILAVIFLGEKSRLGHKVAAAAICFAGVVLIV